MSIKKAVAKKKLQAKKVASGKKRNSTRKTSTNKKSGGKKRFFKKKAIVRKKRKSKKKSANSKKRLPEKKVKTKQRGGSERVKEVFIDWSKMKSPKKLYVALLSQLNVNDSDRITNSSYPLHQLRYTVSSRMEASYLPYRFVNVNVSRVKPAMHEMMDTVIEEVMRDSIRKAPDTEVHIYTDEVKSIEHSIPDPASKGRSKFITAIARAEWPPNKKLPPPGPARNNEIHRINMLHDQAVEYFVTTSDSSEELHLLTTNYSWNQGYKGLMELVNNPACDLNTALLIFWSSGADYFQREHSKRPSEKAFGGFHRIAWDLVHTIMMNVARGKYKESAMPDEFKSRIVSNPTGQQLWKIDKLMYGDALKMGRKKKTGKKEIGKKTTKKKARTKKNAPKKTLESSHVYHSSKTQLQLHREQLQNVTHAKKQYFSNHEIESTHVTEEVATNLYSYFVYYYDSTDNLVEVRFYSDDVNYMSKDEHDPSLKELVEKGRLYRDYRLNQPYEFEPNKRGKNHLGGAPPKEFVVPETSSGDAFQYLGLLSHSDPAFDLCHDFHLVYPVYSDFSVKVWLDYKNPTAPSIMNQKELANLYIDEDLLPEDEIVLEKIRFKTTPWPVKTKRGGHTSLPRWIQNPDAPVCPKTKKPMELLCQLGEGGLSRVEMKNSVIPQKPVGETDFVGNYETESLTSGDGDLFVFYSKAAKVACYLWQGT